MTEMAHFYAYQKFLDHAKDKYFCSMKGLDELRYFEARRQMQEILGDAILLGSVETMTYHLSLIKWMSDFWVDHALLSKRVHEEILKTEIGEQNG